MKSVRWSLPVLMGATVFGFVSTAGASALHDAAKAGDFARVKLLLSKGNDIKAKDNDAYTALHWVAEFGYIDIAKLLLVKGADINAIDQYNSTSLHVAAGNSHTELVKLLLGGQ